MHNAQRYCTRATETGPETIEPNSLTPMVSYIFPRLVPVQFETWDCIGMYCYRLLAESMLQLLRCVFGSCILATVGTTQSLIKTSVKWSIRSLETFVRRRSYNGLIESPLTLRLASLLACGILPGLLATGLAPTQPPRSTECRDIRLQIQLFL